MVPRSSEKLTIDSAFRVPKCDELAGASQKLRASQFGIYGVSYPVHGVIYPTLPYINFIRGFARFVRVTSFHILTNPF